MNQSSHRYFILNKPPNMVSQFVSSHAVQLLGDLHFPFPQGIHAIGRLDSHSEGLLLLTTNQKVTRLLFQSGTPHERTYLVQVKYKVSNESLEQLRMGVSFLVKGAIPYVSKPLRVSIVTDPKQYADWEMEQRPYGENTWLLITLTEGKFHQVRKMVFAIGHRCVRLIRVSIEDLELGTLKPGEIREMEESEFFKLLKLDTSSIASGKPGPG